MGIILDLLNFAAYIPFLRVDEQEIGRNIQQLKRHQWFQDFLNDEQYRKLIIHNKDVRQTIGKFKTSKLSKDAYNSKCQKKLSKVLLKVA
ncbi:hypothetical protein HNO89_000461 [Sporosarcina luteola]|nr:hypothetical protein [Sporosarcina luteola]